MRWDATGYGTHADNGVPAARTRWFLAEGVTGAFDTYVLVYNPSDTAAQLTMTLQPHRTQPAGGADLHPGAAPAAHRGRRRRRPGARGDRRRHRRHLDQRRRRRGRALRVPVEPDHDLRGRHRIVGGRGRHAVVLRGGRGERHLRHVPALLQPQRRRRRGPGPLHAALRRAGDRDLHDRGRQPAVGLDGPRRRARSAGVRDGRDLHERRAGRRRARRLGRRRAVHRRPRLAGALARPACAGG